MGKIITICNQKGGVGKTTTTLSLSAYLAELGKKVLVVDADPQGNASSGIGIDKTKIEKSLYQAIIGEIPLSETFKTTEITNLTIVPSSSDLSGAEIEMVTMSGREALLKKALNPHKADFDFIIIDCPPSLGLLTINSLVASDSVLIPIQCEYYALEGLSQLIKTINLVRDRLNSTLKIEGILLTMADYRTNLTREVIDEARSYFGDKIFKTIIPRSVRLGEAPSFGKPISVYDKHSAGAKRYEELAKELLLLNGQSVEDNAPDPNIEPEQVEKATVESVT
ncbi:MAG: ParA family protein [Candidatus Omnitrophica bacterium]|nr:ParA family protein [Candidatus Omnitrophota bacterium]